MTRMKELRKKKGFSQVRMQMLTGIDQSDYSKIETGKRNMSFEQCRRIALALETSMDYLAGLTDQRRQQVIVSAPAPAPKRGRDPWRKMAICNSCDWRRRMAAPCGDWDGTACMYTHETGIFRESPPTDDYCAYYKSRQR